MALNFLNNGYFGGKLGIGTESPDAKLSISDILGISGTGNNTYGQVDLVNTQTGASGDEIGPFITFRGKRGGVDSVIAAYGAIGGVNTGTTGSSTGAITFLTKNVVGAAQDLVEQMRISTGGNVGIGTTGPAYKLDVNSSAFVGARIESTAAGYAPASILLESGNSDSRGQGIYQYNSVSKNSWFSGVPYSTTSDDWIIAHKLETTAFNSDVAQMSNSLFCINDNGNVGIGTTSVTTHRLIVSGGSNIASFRSEGSGQNLKKLSISTGGDRVVLDASTTTDTTAAFAFQTGGVERMRILDLGGIKFNAYDSTNQTGTPTYLLGTDASGNVVKTLPQGSGTAGPYLPLAGGTMTGDLRLNDSIELELGSDADIRMYHDNSNGYINSFKGDLYIRTFDDDKDIIFQSDNGSGGTTEYFRVDGGITKTVFVRDTKHLDNKKALFGDQDDLQIYHDGTHSHIINNTGDLTIDSQGDDLLLKAADDLLLYVQGNEVALQAIGNAGVKIRYNNVVKFETTSTGVSVTGDINIDSALLSNQENTDVDTGTETVASVAIATYTAGFFDFVIKKTTNVRSGTVYACHDGTNVEFTETSTNDLGDTSDVTLSVDISGGNMRLRATTTSDDWSVKSLIRAI